MSLYIAIHFAPSKVNKMNLLFGTIYAWTFNRDYESKLKHYEKVINYLFSIAHFGNNTGTGKKLP